MAFVCQNAPTIPYTNRICMREPTCAESHHLVDIWQTGLNNVLRMSVTSFVYLSSQCAKHSYKVEFLHLRPFYLQPSVKLVFVSANEGEILRIR